MADLIAPDGTTGSAPESEVPRLLASGYRHAEAPAAEIVMPERTPSELVNLRAPDGTIGTAPISEVGRLAGQGYAPLSDDDLQRDERRQFNESALGQAATVGEGLAQGATLGLYGAGMGLADEGYRDRLEERSEDNPYLSGTAEVAGAVLPGLLSGGTSALGSVARATPAGLVERAGAALGSYVARQGVSAGARILGAATAGAVEGALSNAVMATADEFPELTADPAAAAERILAASLEGGLLGGAVGGGLGLLSEGLHSAARSIEARELRRADELAKQAEIAPKVDADNYAQVAVDLEAKPLTSADMLARDARPNHLKALDEWRAAQGGADDAIQSAIPTIEKELNTALDDIAFVDSEAGVAAKLDTIAKREGLDIKPRVAEIDGKEVVQQAPVVERMFEELRSVQSDMTNFAARFGSKLDYDGGGAALTRIESRIKDAARKMKAAADEGDFRTFYGEADDVKRTMQKVANGTRNADVRNYLRDLNGGAEKFRVFMEDTSVWGKAGDFQKAWNAPVADRIRRSGDQRIGGLLVGQSGDQSAVDLFEAADRVNGESLGAFLSRIGTGNEFAGKEQATRLWLRSMAKDVANRAALTGDEGLKQRAVRAVQSIAKVEQQLDTVARKNADAIAGKRAMQVAPATELLSNVASSLVPFSGVAIQGVAKLKRQVMMTMANTAGDVEGKILNAAGKLVRGAKKGVKAVGKSAPMAAAAIDREIRGAQELQDPQSPAYQAMVRDAANLEDTVPGMGMAYMQATQARSAFIASKLPVAPSSAIFAPSARLDPTSDRKMRRYVAASYAPAAALDRIAAGTASFEDVETVRTLYPTLYRSFQRAVEAELASMKRPPDLQTRLRLAYMTGLPVDPSVENVSRLQRIATSGASSGEQAQEQSAGTQGVKLSSNPDQVYGSRADQVMAQR